MEITDYVSYELAVKLKAAGFYEPCEAFYLPPMKNRPEPFFSGRVKRSIKNGTHAFHLSAPSLYHAQKWLREKKKMHCQVLLNGVRSMYFWQVREMIGNGRYADSTHQYDVYEDAMSDCIAAALELIKKGE